MVGERREVAVVIPRYREVLTASEQISLVHLKRYLSGFDRIFLAPEGLAIDEPGFACTRFEPACFESVHSYSKLLLSPRFYRAFSGYHYILIYQLDCLVFSSDLSSWCQKGWDYIGAPWLRDLAQPQLGFKAVGNGGLSLRRVDAHLAVLKRTNPLRNPREIGRALFTRQFADLAHLPWLRRWQKKLRVLAQIRWGGPLYAARYSLNEDLFWAFRAPLLHPGFRIAPPDQAVAFSFEAAPAYCLTRNRGQLPFGCHAWEKWDRQFWLSHLPPNGVAGSPLETQMLPKG